MSEFRLGRWAKHEAGRQTILVVIRMWGIAVVPLPLAATRQGRDHSLLLQFIAEQVERHTSEAEDSRGTSSSESAVEWLLMPRSKSIWRPGKSSVLLLLVRAAQ